MNKSLMLWQQTPVVERPVYTYIHLPATSLTAPPPVAVDVVGCTSQRLSPMDISSCKSIASFALC